MPIATGSTVPVSLLRSVTPHATDDLPAPGVCRALWVGVAGDISLIAEDDTAAVTIVGIQAGALLPIRVKAVRVAGTTATSIVALY